MKFIILGSSPGLPVPEKHLSAIYVQTADKNILFDCGDGTHRRLMKHGLTGNHLDAIAISHFHPDHICGIYMVLQMLYLEGRTKPLQLFLPERPAAFLDSLHMFYTFEQKFGYELELLPVDDLEFHLPGVASQYSDHLQGYSKIIQSLQLPNTMQSYSFRIEDPQGALVYTSDLGSGDHLEAMLPNCHTIIVDAIHPPAQAVLKLEQYPIKRIILNHGISEELQQWLEQNPSGLYDFAVEDVVYTI